MIYWHIVSHGKDYLIYLGEGFHSFIAKQVNFDKVSALVQWLKLHSLDWQGTTGGLYNILKKIMAPLTQMC